MIRRSMGVGGIPAYAGMTLEGAGMMLEGVETAWGWANIEIMTRK